MTVIDLREELKNRSVDIIEITDDCVYYAEEFSVNDTDTMYVYTYDFFDKSEHIVTYFTYDDEAYLPHYYVCGDSIIMLFENDGNRAWIIRIDKNSGCEIQRRRVSIIGRFFDCIPIDDNNIIIYSKADDEYREIFNKSISETGCDVFANLYDLEKNYRYFIRDFKTAELVRSNMRCFSDSKGIPRMLLCDNRCKNETEKERLFCKKGNSNTELRDIIFEISRERFIENVKSGKEKIGAKRIAAAGAEGLVRLECIGDDGIVFRAKVFRTGAEQFLRMSKSSGSVKPICNVKVKNDFSRYFTDAANAKIYYLKREGENILLHGEINSKAEIVYPYTIGNFTGCIEDRYVLADSSESFNKPSLSIYDGSLGSVEKYDARMKIKNNMLVIY